MGRLPSTYAGMQIMFRVPFAMQTTLDLPQNTASQFPEFPVTHSIDKPFEIHRMIPRITAIAGNKVIQAAQPSDDLMEALISISIRDFGKNNSLTKAVTPLGNLVRGSAERTWEFAAPYYLKQGDGFEINAVSGSYPVDGQGTPIANVLRAQISFIGCLIVVAPPTEQR